MTFINRFIGLLIRPKIEWKKIKSEKTDFKQILKTFLLPLFSIQIITSFTKILLTGPYKGLNRVNSLILATLFPFIELQYIYLSSKVINLFAPKFGVEKNIINSIKVTSYCSANIIITIIIQLIPIKNIGLISLLSLFYLKYNGLRIIMGSRNNTFFYAMIPELFILLFALLLILAGIIIQ